MPDTVPEGTSVFCEPLGSRFRRDPNSCKIADEIPESTPPTGQHRPVDLTHENRRKTRFFARSTLKHDGLRASQLFLVRVQAPRLDHERAFDFVILREHGEPPGLPLQFRRFPAALARSSAL